MKWVKGELLIDLAAAELDPTRHLARNFQPVIFNRRDWFERVWRHYPSEAISPLIARSTSEGAIAWLFLAREAGGKAVALTNWYSFAYAPVYKGDPDDRRQRALLTAIARRLAKARPAISQITLGPVRRDATTANLLHAFGRGGWIAATRQISTSWTANVAGMSFDEFWAARPGQLRNTYCRKRNKADFAITIHDHFDEAAWSEYEAVYAESWKPEEGAPAFLRETAIAEGDAGCVRIGICRIDGEAVAAQYWTVENGVAYIHKLAYRETARPLSPGTILSHAMFARVIDVDHVETIDFGTGDDAYKADWMDSAAPLDQITLFNRSTSAGLIKAGIETAKSFMRGDRRLRPIAERPEMDETSQ